MVYTEVCTAAANQTQLLWPYLLQQLTISMVQETPAIGDAWSHLEFEWQLMPILIKQSDRQGQHDRLLVGVARGGGGALLGVDGVSLCTRVVAGGHLQLWGACLLIPATS